MDRIRIQNETASDVYQSMVLERFESGTPAFSAADLKAALNRSKNWRAYYGALNGWSSTSVPNPILADVWESVCQIVAEVTQK